MRLMTNQTIMNQGGRNQFLTPSTYFLIELLHILVILSCDLSAMNFLHDFSSLLWFADQTQSKKNLWKNLYWTEETGVISRNLFTTLVFLKIVFLIVGIVELIADSDLGEWFSKDILVTTFRGYSKTTFTRQGR